MRTSVSTTSIDAYKAMGPRLGRQQQVIVSYLAKNAHRDYTRAELAQYVGMRLSSVCGRVKELLDLHIVTECPRRPCSTTKINAHPVRLAPAQMDLL